MFTRPSRFHRRTRELLSLAILRLLRKHSNKQTNIQLQGQRKLEYRLDEHLKFTGKTSDQRKFSRSALAEAYVDKRVAGLGKKGATKYRYRPTSAAEKSNAQWDGLVDL